MIRVNKLVINRLNEISNAQKSKEVMLSKCLDGFEVKLFKLGYNLVMDKITRKKVRPSSSKMVIKRVRMWYRGARCIKYSMPYKDVPQNV